MIEGKVVMEMLEYQRKKRFQQQGKRLYESSVKLSNALRDMK